MYLILRRGDSMADQEEIKKYEIYTLMAIILFTLACKTVCTKMSHTYWYILYMCHVKETNVDARADFYCE